MIWQPSAQPTWVIARVCLIPPSVSSEVLPLLAPPNVSGLMVEEPTCLFWIHLMHTLLPTCEPSG